MWGWAWRGPQNGPFSDWTALQGEDPQAEGKKGEQPEHVPSWTGTCGLRLSPSALGSVSGNDAAIPSHPRWKLQRHLSLPLVLNLPLSPSPSNIVSSFTE